MRDIYSCASVVLCLPVDEVDELSLFHSIDVQPFSLFLNWSEPEHVVSFEQCLRTPSWNGASRSWTQQELLLSYHVLKRCWLKLASSHHICGPNAEQGIAAAFESNEPNSRKKDIKGSDELFAAKNSENQIPVSDSECNHASLSIEDGIRYVETSKGFEALASFMAARDLVSAYKPLNLRSRRIHAVASAKYRICL